MCLHQSMHGEPDAAVCNRTLLFHEHGFPAVHHKSRDRKAVLRIAAIYGQRNEFNRACRSPQCNVCSQLWPLKRKKNPQQQDCSRPPLAETFSILTEQHGSSAACINMSQKLRIKQAEPQANHAVSKGIKHLKKRLCASSSSIQS